MAYKIEQLQQDNRRTSNQPNNKAVQKPSPTKTQRKPRKQQQSYNAVDNLLASVLVVVFYLGLTAIIIAAVIKFLLWMF